MDSQVLYSSKEGGFSCAFSINTISSTVLRWIFSKSLYLLFSSKRHYRVVCGEGLVASLEEKIEIVHAFRFDQQKRLEAALLERRVRNFRFTQ
jgi:hypothetical protein